MTTSTIIPRKHISTHQWASCTHEALKALGVNDYPFCELSRSFVELDATGYVGRLFVRPSSIQVPFSRLVQVVGEIRPDSVPGFARRPDPWAYGEQPDYLTEEELSGTSQAHEPLIALYNQENTGYDPLLFALGLPFDEECRRISDRTTQLEKVEVSIENLTAMHKHDACVNTLRDYLFWVLQDYFQNIDPKSGSFVMSDGQMVDPTLGSRQIDGASHLILAHSSFGQATLYKGWNDGENHDIGVSFSLGLRR